MKVLLSHAYFISEDPKEQKIMRPYPPLGLLYISAYLNENNIENEVFDSTFSTFDSLLSHIIDKRPKYLALYTNLMTKINIVRIIKACEKLDHKPIVILGGPDVSYNVEDYLKAGSDYLVIGEGEETITELINTLEENKKERELVNGIAFFNDSRKLIKTKARIKIKDIDELPIPNRRAIDLNQYLTAWKKHHEENAINVSTQRGCPYTCKWCSTAVYGQSYRRRSPQKVVEELIEIQREYNPDMIWFVDDVFTVSHKWLTGFAEEVKKSNLTIRYECISRAERMNEEVLQLLKESGCARIWIGAESGSQKIIDAMDRRVSVEKVREMIQKTKTYDIQVGTFIMIGYPGETEDDIYETINHLKVSNPDIFTITLTYPIKGTDLYEEIKDIQTNTLDWETSSDRDRNFKRTYSDKYYAYALRKVINEVNYFKAKESSIIKPSTLKFKLLSLYADVGMKFYRSSS